MQILLLQDRTDVREKISFFIESTYEAIVHEAATVADAIKVLDKEKDPFDLIIIDSKSGSPNESGAFKAKAGTIPTLLCIQGAPDGALITGSVVGLIDRASFTENLVNTMNGLIDKGILKPQKAEDVAQVRIRTKLLLAVIPLKGDIYIRLNKTKFVKLFHEGDVFDLADLEKYTIKKGVEYLFIRREQCQEFAQKYRAELQKLLVSENLAVEDVNKLGESVHETVQELTRQIGFTKEVQELTKTHVQLTVKSMGKDPDLAELLKKLQSSEGKYISSHSTLCAFLACAIAAQLKWGSETTFHKLTLASFLHDVTLENHDLAMLNTLADLEKAKDKFSAKEQKDFKDHPNFAAEMVKKMTEVPPDVDTIIRQHHERPDGSGFPRGLGHAYIAPLSSVFIVSHDLAQYTLSSGESFNAGTFLDSVKEKYKSSQFKKVLSCMEVLHKIKGLSAEIGKSKKA